MFTDILGALPAVTPYAIFILILVYLGKLLMGAESRHTAELKRMSAAHDEELIELRSDIKQLRIDFDELTAEWKKERSERYKAEEEAFRLRLQLRGLIGETDNEH